MSGELGQRCLISSCILRQSNPDDLSNFENNCMSWTAYPDIPMNSSSFISKWWGFVTKFNVSHCLSSGNINELIGYWGKYADEKSYEPGIKSVSIAWINEFSHFSKLSYDSDRSLYTLYSSYYEFFCKLTFSWHAAFCVSLFALDLIMDFHGLNPHI